MGKLPTEADGSRCRSGTLLFLPLSMTTATTARPGDPFYRRPWTRPPHGTAMANSNPLLERHWARACHSWLDPALPPSAHVIGEEIGRPSSDWLPVMPGFFVGDWRGWLSLM